MTKPESPINIPFLIFVLAVIQFLHILDFMIIMPLGNLFMEQLNISPKQFSNFVAWYAYAAFISGIISSSIIDRFDRKNALLFLFTGFTLSTLLCGLVNDFIYLNICRGLTGFFGGVISALVLSIIADVVPYEKRSQANGWVMTAFSVASIGGVPAGIWIADNYGWRGPFLCVGVLSLIMIFFIFWKIPPLRIHLDKYKEKKHFLNSFSSLTKNQMMALLFSFMLIMGHFTMIPFIAPYMEVNVGFSFKQISYIYLFGGICSALTLPNIGKIADRKGNQKVFVIASIFALIPIFLITNLAYVPIFIALMVTSSYFIISGCRTVPATTIVTAVVKPENRAGFMSLRASVNELALGIGSTIAGFLVYESADNCLVGYDKVGYITMAFTLVALGLSFFLRRDEV